MRKASADGAEFAGYSLEIGGIRELCGCFLSKQRELRDTRTG
jgi:hypothetical protein